MIFHARVRVSPIRVCVCVCVLCPQLLGKRLGAAFKKVLPVIKDLPSAVLQTFLSTGTLVVEGHTITLEEVVISREFSGDTEVYDAAGNEQGTVTVVVNHVISDDLKAMVRDHTLTHALLAEHAL